MAGSSNPVLTNNIIIGGEATTLSRGIYPTRINTVNAPLQLNNNTIFCIGGSPDSRPVEKGQYCIPEEVNNNIIFNLSTAGTAYGIHALLESSSYRIEDLCRNLIFYGTSGATFTLFNHNGTLINDDGDGLLNDDADGVIDGVDEELEDVALTTSTYNKTLTSETLSDVFTNYPRYSDGTVAIEYTSNGDGDGSYEGTSTSIEVSDTVFTNVQTSRTANGGIYYLEHMADNVVRTITNMSGNIIEFTPALDRPSKSGHVVFFWPSSSNLTEWEIDTSGPADLNGGGWNQTDDAGANASNVGRL
jgi:hypothetical protein